MDSHQSLPAFEDILIVDDNPDNLRVLSAILTKQGYQVRKIISGPLALKVIDAAPPALILLDILMPEMDGYQVCSLLKANPATAEIPIIFISALDDVFDKVKAFEIGAVDYITKPFQAAEILARVKHQLTLRDLYLQLQKKHQSLQQKNEILQQEIKERKRAESEIYLLLKATQVMSNAEDFNSALKGILRQVCETIGWDLGEAWVPSKDSQNLEINQGSYVKEDRFKKFQDGSENLKFSLRDGLPGQILSSQKPEWIGDLSLADDPLFLRSELAIAVGLKVALCLPILLDNQVLAVLVFFKAEEIKRDQRLIELVAAVATQLSTFIQRKQAEVALRTVNMELQRLATLDGLTGVANRRRFDQYLSQEWRRLAREQLPLSLIFCDIDYFKKYNDTYGHLAGDFCLKQVAQTLSQTVRRPADIVARYGGEEFAILLPNTPEEGALKVAEMIRKEVQNLKIDHPKSTVHPYVTLSLGVVSFIPQNHLDPSTLVAAADRALYEAKEQGRNRSHLTICELL